MTTTQTETRILVAERSPLMQAWLGAAVSRAIPWRTVAVTTVGDGHDLLQQLAEEPPYDLVVASADLPGVGGGEVLAMARTAGLSCPFLVLSHLSTPRLRALVKRVAHASLLDDPLDVAAVRAAARRILDPTTSPVPMAPPLAAPPRQRAELR